MVLTALWLFSTSLQLIHFSLHNTYWSQTFLQNCMHIILISKALTYDTTTLILLLVEIDILIESSITIITHFHDTIAHFPAATWITWAIQYVTLFTSLLKCLFGSTVFAMFGDYLQISYKTVAFYFFQIIIISSNMFSFLSRPLKWSDQKYCDQPLIF